VTVTVVLVGRCGQAAPPPALVPLAILCPCGGHSAYPYVRVSHPGATVRQERVCLNVMSAEVALYQGRDAVEVSRGSSHVQVHHDHSCCRTLCSLEHARPPPPALPPSPTHAQSTNMHDPPQRTALPTHSSLAHTLLQKSVRRRLLELAGVKDTHECVLIQGSGTYAVEAAVGCAVPRGGKALVITNGSYGDRIADICACLGIEHRTMKVPWTEVPRWVFASICGMSRPELAKCMAWWTRHRPTTSLLTQCDT
jgi:hypothetical protein